ncbi:hypothetical protein IUY40_13930 [Flavobacterium sp. ALJ2]|uniref:hypothetical protein n=1 Tax=Flavobacterium sp. ALJ2 TaxID=2786960 RepID=UPI00189E51D1|nr:hypothetical protein [Flavobacterium sp. ALJ2]MBF7092631.1 hypothetical protein [Flavobacterium sp. ALJ2]
MKKYILMALILLVNTVSFAQKLKIEKGEIKLDDKTLGLVEGKRPIYKYYNLDKTYSVTAEIKSAPNEPSLALPWIELKDEKTGKTNELEFRSRKFSAFNYDRSIAYELLERNYLTTDGLNPEAIESFISGESAGIAAKRLGAQNEIDQANKVADTYQLSIDDAGTIYSIKAQNPDPNDKRIGYIKMTSPAINGELKYEVMDLDQYLIASWYAKSGMVSGYNKYLNQQLITVDRNIISAAFDNKGNPIGYKMSKDKTAMNIVRALIGNGYVLQHQGIDIENKFKEEQSKLNKEKYEEAKLNSVNIYDKNGYVIDEKGEKITGTLKIEFKAITTGNANTSSSLVPGQRLYLTNAIHPFQTYDSKSGIRFCIDESKECFIGLTSKGSNFMSSALKALDTDNSKFYKILYEENGYMVLVDPAVPDDFVIKIPNQDKGLFTTKGSNTKLKKNIIDYLKCDSFVFENHDLKTLDGLIKALGDYKNNCNK